MDNIKDSLQKALKDPKQIWIRKFVTLITNSAGLVLVFLVFSSITNGCGDNIQCGQAAGWALLMLGPICCIAAVVEIIYGIIAIIAMQKSLKSDDAKTIYPSSYTYLYYIGIVVFVAAAIAALIKVFPMIQIFVSALTR